MPIYEFQCQECDKRFEKLCGISGGNGIVCPECESADVKRLISSFYARSAGPGGSSCNCGGSCGGSCSGDCGGCSGCHH